MIRKLRKFSAFTLVESLVYIGIFAIFFTTAVQFSLTVQENNLLATYRKLLGNNAIYVSNHMQDSFYKSLTVNTTASIFDSNDGRLRIENGANYFDYQIVGNTLSVNINGTTSSILYDDVEINKFYIEKVLNATNQIVGIRVNITFQSAKKTFVTYNNLTMYYLK